MKLTGTSKAADNVQATEPGTLTYALFTSSEENKATVFERYRDEEDFKHHCSTEGFKKLSEAMGQLTHTEQVKFMEAEEAEGCFVGNGSV